LSEPHERAIVERVSGMSYYDYVCQNVYQRAGMSKFDFYWKNEDTPNLAKVPVK
jgi:CubicO group peptidase (beta-lactamase class C family)